MEQQQEQKVAMVVGAHPDDETGMAATLAEYGRQLIPEFGQGTATQRVARPEDLARVLKPTLVDIAVAPAR